MIRDKDKVAPAYRGAFLMLATTITALLAVLTLSNVAYAQSGENAGVYDEAEAQAIDRMLMCPVCPAQTIDQTEVPLAKQMRAQVRELLAGGATRKEVLDWFAAPERYGPSVLAEPPRSGFYLIAWIVPGVIVVAGLVGGLLTLRAMRRRADDNPSEPTGETDDLQPYLAAVDRDLALDKDDANAE
ncbi:MAG: cytochrome c-type biogenesis protein CcmH [Chloroflexota bacterium]|nr:cytochrome c-type biogenesis protein CcmH [Chloroflexota bacterium]MDE2682960.1 cytochrome c-type biogenesis protein CcmH [Chloroflexota bacterium]